MHPRRCLHNYTASLYKRSCSCCGDNYMQSVPCHSLTFLYGCNWSWNSGQHSGPVPDAARPDTDRRRCHTDNHLLQLLFLRWSFGLCFWNCKYFCPSWLCTLALCTDKSFRPVHFCQLWWSHFFFWHFSGMTTFRYHIGTPCSRLPVRYSSRKDLRFYCPWSNTCKAPVSADWPLHQWYLIQSPRYILRCPDHTPCRHRPVCRNIDVRLLP